jgi:DNA-binding transcriptional LysR family regulator
MDLNQIRSFLAVTQTLNFTNAAKENGVPQSTISRQISDLESQLGARLFYRTRRSVELTQEGRTLLPYAIEMVEAARKGALAVRQLHDGGRGRLAIATIETPGPFLTDCLRAFGEKYPQVVVDLTYVSSGDALQDEGRDPFDFHFIYGDMLPEGEDFDTLFTHTDRLCLVTPKGHPLARGGWDPSRLNGERFLLVSEQESPILYMLIQNYFRACRLAPHVVNQSDSVHAVLLSVSAGLGVTILPSAQPREILHDQLELTPLPGMEEPIPYAMAWKKSLLNPAARLFLEVVRERIAKPET